MENKITRFRSPRVISTSVNKVETDVSANENQHLAKKTAAKDNGKEASKGPKVPKRKSKEARKTWAN